MTPRRRSRSRGVTLAAFVAVLLAISPFAAPPALAGGEDTLRTDAQAIYTVDPEDGRVHVEIDVTQTSLKRNTATIRYFYIQFGFALQPEAKNIRVSGGSAYRITTRKRDGYIEATVFIGRSISYRQSSSFTIRYDLIGGDPRSESPNRVGAAFATFDIWAWGDPGRSYVEVRTPPGFISVYDGGPLKSTTTPTQQFLFAEPEDPARFYAIIRSENRDAYTEERISFDGGVEIVVQAWPEDEAWGETVESTLREGVPELLELIGLDWPVSHDLRVLERYTPALEGYAGVFLTREERIEVSEDLDPDVIVHEVSHAWFNDDLFVERWIYEGFAQDYATRVLQAIGSDGVRSARRPSVDDPGFADLAFWRHPRVIRDQETDDIEQFGYGASYWVIHQIVEAAGLERMRAAFAGAEANLTAYPGAGAPETVAESDTWQRLLDLVQPIDAPADDPHWTGVDRALRDFVLSSNGEQALDERNDARAAYLDLLEAGDGWLAPWYVRRSLGSWQFDDATERMAEATAVLELRGQVEAAAGAIDLDPDDALEVAYEGAENDFDGAASIANAQLATLATLADARAKVDATPDLVAQVGLIGETPRVPYDAARTAFESGDLAEATRLAGVAAALITGATAVGQTRLIAAVGIALAVLLLLAAIVWLRRRGRRRSLLLAAAAPAGALDAQPAPVLAGALPTGTLAADPAGAPPSASQPPDDEGGAAPRDLPADP